MPLPNLFHFFQDFCFHFPICILNFEIDFQKAPKLLEENKIKTWNKETTVATHNQFNNLHNPLDIYEVTGFRATIRDVACKTFECRAASRNANVPLWYDDLGVTNHSAVAAERRVSASAA